MVLIVPATQPATQPKTLASTVPLNTLTPINLSPRDIALGGTPPDPALAGWLDQWQVKFLAGQKLWLSDINDYQRLLKASPLKATDLLALAHAIHYLNPEDTHLAARIYDAASYRVESEFAATSAAGVPTGVSPNSVLSPQSSTLVLAIANEIPNMKLVLWPLIETAGETQYASTLYRIYSGFVAHIPADNKDLQNAARHPAIGVAETLYALDKPQEALDLLQKLPSDSMKGSEKSAWAWAMALNLLKLHKDADAEPYLKITAADKGGKYAEAAAELLEPAATQASGQLSVVSGQTGAQSSALTPQDSLPQSSALSPQHSRKDLP